MNGYQEEIAKIQAETARIRRIHEAFKQTIAMQDAKPALGKTMKRYISEGSCH